MQKNEMRNEGITVRKKKESLAGWCMKGEQTRLCQQWIEGWKLQYAQADTHPLTGCRPSSVPCIASL